MLFVLFVICPIRIHDFLNPHSSRCLMGKKKTKITTCLDVMILNLFPMKSPDCWEVQLRSSWEFQEWPPSTRANSMTATWPPSVAPWPIVTTWIRTRVGCCWAPCLGLWANAGWFIDLYFSIYWESCSQLTSSSEG